MEQWKCIKKIKRNSGLEVRYMLSDKGNVKLEAYIQNRFVGEEYLKLGYGIYVSGPEICIWNVGTYYRPLYKLFKNDIPKGYQIHHKDYNHYNNDINNLICVTAYEHGKLHVNSNNYMNGIIPHKEDELYNDYQLWLKANDIKDKICKTKYTYEEARNDVLNKIYTMFENLSQPIREQIKQERKQLMEQNKQQRLLDIEKDRQLKLQSGNYYIDNKGRLRPRNIALWTEERREKTSSEYRQRLSKSITEWWKTR